MRIAFDADGVIWRLNDAVLPIIELVTGQKIDAMDLTEWDWFKRRGVKSSAFYAVCSMLGLGSYYKAIEPYDSHTADAIRAISAGHEMFVLSGMSEDRVAGLEKWLDARGILDCFTHIEVSKNVTSKFDHRFDMLVDDCPLLVNQHRKYGDGRLFALMHAPWNRGVRNVAQAQPGVRVVDGWRDLETYIYSLEETYA